MQMKDVKKIPLMNKRTKYHITFYLFLLPLFMGYSQLNTDRILTIGRNALYFEDFVLSIQYFNQVIDIKPFLAEPYMYRSIAKIQLGDFEGAELDGSEAIQRNPFLPEAYYARGFSRMRLGNYEGAALDFTKAIEFSPTSQHLILSRMDAFERLGRFKEALLDVEQMMKLNPRNSQLNYEKGRVQLSLKDTIGAEKSFTKLIQADSTSPIGWSARALLYHQKNQLKAAYNDYSKAIEQKSTHFGDYMNRGIINVQERRFMEALKDYDKAIALEPKNMLAFFNRGILRSDLGDDNNALSDFIQVLKMDSSLMEARYSKALLELKLKNFNEAIRDYQLILKKHEYFLPAYWGIAQAYDGLNNVREAYRFRQKAYELDRDKDNIRQKMKQDLEAKNKIAEEQPGEKNTKKTDVFNRYATQNIDENTYESKYSDFRRGQVQRRFVDVVNEKNFVISYYSKDDQLRRTTLYHPLLAEYNRKRVLPASIKITALEIPLTNELIQQHFDHINSITSQLREKENDADLYFYRALEYALIQDFTNSIEDLNKAIQLRGDFVLAYFMRANIRYKYTDYRKNAVRENQSVSFSDGRETGVPDSEYKLDIEMVLRDLDKVNELQPDFSFAFYNKANILSGQKDFKTAIQLYSKAIDQDKNFAEAYFNRGLTYLFTGEETKGLADLSKAGELGIYGAYNLIQRFK
jgi:tetratricopeptide (TPR) repeat protein